MDHRIEDIFVSLLTNIETLDDTLMRISSSDLFEAGDESFGLLEQIRESCISTLQSVQSVERRLQSKAFIMPPDAMRAME